VDSAPTASRVIITVVTITRLAVGAESTTQLVAPDLRNVA